MSLSAGSEGKVLAAEADPLVHAVLKRNIAANDFSADAICARIGLPPNVTADQMVGDWRLRRVDFLKVDVDGSDLAVLHGGVETLWRFHPVVVVEITRDQAAIFDFLRDAGYGFVTGMSGEPVEPGSWPPNLFASTRPIRVPKWGEIAARREAGSA